ncbi:MAG: metallophosphatase family protein [Planctomycetes bacterium]|nr:metallophosphatase family protein [Planctomycetota bacterium]
MLSDSHGQVGITRRAVGLLVSQQADLILHMGDIGSPTVLDALVVARPGSDQPLLVRVVFGNVDFDREDLAAHGRAIGLNIDDPVGVVSFEGGELVFTHGDDGRALSDAIGRKVRYLCHGHTHRVTDERRGATRVINPGALFRTAQHTVALLDTDADSLSVHTLA